MTLVKVGSLVESYSSFSGVGKIVSVDPLAQTAVVGFFHSPNAPAANSIEVHVTDLKLREQLQSQSTVFCRIGQKQRWMLGFYEGPRPGEQHLVKFNRDLSDVFDVEDLHVPNLEGGTRFEPHEFLKAKATVTPYLCEARAKFYDTHVAQRGACRSLSSLLSSAVEFEPHQLAVVSRVLSDEKRKYLLCDEVGLGKTIESALIVRHHVQERGSEARVFVLTPSTLTNQWQQELTERFHLGDILSLASDELDPSDDTQLVYLGDFRDIDKLSETLGVPTMVVIDEAHQLAQLGWSENLVDRYCFDVLSEMSNQAEISLLLTGTPLVGCEKDYLAMLHCLEREKYTLTDNGVEEFKAQIEQQKRFVGLYRALDPDHDNGTLEGILEEIEDLELLDEHLSDLIEETKPYVDFFADEDEIDADDRARAVLAVRTHFADRYTFNYRMLRNRRDSSNGSQEKSTIQHLFPGLGECDLVSWDLPQIDTLQDQQLNDLRAVANYDPDMKSGLDSTNYLQWVEAMMLSPNYLAKQAGERLKVSNLSEEERVYWQGIVDVAVDEQRAKNKALLERIGSWLHEYPDGKAVVFCGEASVADEVCLVLVEHFGETVERHQPLETPQFTVDDKVRVFVCDERGEDGLNLQGRKRLAIHYSLPLSVNRIEQRNGRLNRYSAFSKACFPIETCILIPARDGFYRQWALLLRDGIGAFKHYRASIQEPIDAFLAASWPGLWQEGFEHVPEMVAQLSGSDGIVARELKQLEIQDSMDRDMLDVREAIRFSQKIEENDEQYEQVPEQLLDWMVNGLLFDKRGGDEAGQFKLQFVHERTRLNVDNLKEHCIIGLDFESSSYKAPVTHLMSADRTVCARTGAYPLRYGQPFVDAVASMSEHLPIGIASTYLRQVKVKLGDPRVCFKTQWIVSLDKAGQSQFEQLQRDQIATPMMISDIFHSNGKLMDSSPAKTLLAAPYRKKATGLDLGGTAIQYVDQNISLSLLSGEWLDMWDFVEQVYEQRYWEDMIDLVYLGSRQHALEAFSAQHPLVPLEDIEPKLLSIQAVILMGEG